MMPPATARNWPCPGIRPMPTAIIRPRRTSPPICLPFRFISGSRLRLLEQMSATSILTHPPIHYGILKHLIRDKAVISDASAPPGGRAAALRTHFLHPSSCPTGDRLTHCDGDADSYPA